MTDEIRAKLTVASDVLSPQEIAALVGIEPDDTQVKGEKNRLSTKEYAQHVWRIRNGESILSDATRIEQMERCISQLLRRVASSAPAIRRLSGDNLVEIGIYIFAREVPPIELTKEQVESIARLGATEDIDVVLYSEQ